MNMEFLILNKKLYKQIIFNVMTIVISFRIEFNLRFYGRETFWFQTYVYFRWFLRLLLLLRHTRWSRTFLE